MVSIAAFQAVDPGSIPGPRIFLPRKKKKEAPKRMGTMGIEPMTNGLLDQRSTD